MTHLSIFRIFSCLSNKKNEVLSGEQGKESIICEDGIEKFLPCDHRLSSLASLVMPIGDS